MWKWLCRARYGAQITVLDVLSKRFDVLSAPVRWVDLAADTRTAVAYLGLGLGGNPDLALPMTE
jgi:hypothetical protein